MFFLNKNYFCNATEHKQVVEEHQGRDCEGIGRRFPEVRRAAAEIHRRENGPS